MELRAAEDVEMSRDLAPPLPPIAAALHDHFLLSHCSSCFRPNPATPSNQTPSPLPCCAAPLRYCSTACLASDSDRHLSSGECALFRLLVQQAADDTADVRVALRLFRFFEGAGLLPSSRAGLGRIGGLLGCNYEVWEDGSEMARRVREGAAMMACARRPIGGGNVELEEAILWIVVLNGVEVQVGEWGALGVAVYGPQFSWFNHSCSPSASYRFELAGSGMVDVDGSGCLVYPAGEGREEEASALWKTWCSDQSKSTQELCSYGPKIIVRSIIPIRKSEEICITYTDLMQPKGVRHLDLWEKYHFVCCCDRCIALPENHVDRMLREYFACPLNPKLNVCGSCDDELSEDLAPKLELTIHEYLSDEDHKACCEKIESILSESFNDEQPSLQTSYRKLKLQPLHHLSLNAYTTLASAYKIRSNISLNTDSSSSINLEAQKMSQAASAYSLLLAGATHHLFLFEHCLIGPAALFWIDAGESLLTLVSNLNGLGTKLDRSEVRSLLQHPLAMNTTGEEDFTGKPTRHDAISANFLICFRRISIEVWPVLTVGIRCLKNIKSPVDFSWLDRTEVPPWLLHIQSYSHSRHSGNEEDVCIGCICSQVDICIEEKNKMFYQLAVHCLAYGRYLATICYGSRCSLVSCVSSFLW